MMNAQKTVYLIGAIPVLYNTVELAFGQLLGSEQVQVAQWDPSTASGKPENGAIFIVCCYNSDRAISDLLERPSISSENIINANGYRTDHPDIDSIPLHDLLSNSKLLSEKLKIAPPNQEEPLSSEGGLKRNL